MKLTAVAESQSTSMNSNDLENHVQMNTKDFSRIVVIKNEIAKHC